MKTEVKAMGLIGIFALMAITGVSFATLSGPSPIPNPPTFSVSSNLTTLCKGLTNYIPIIVYNGGNNNPSIGITDLVNTNMQFINLAVSPSRSLLPEGNGTAFIPSLSSFNSIMVLLPVFVTANASLLTTAQVGINYYYLTYYEDQESRNITFEVESCGSPLSVNIQPKTVASGQIQNLSINVTNTGNTTLNSVYVHYSVPSIDGAIIGSSQAQFGSLTPGQSQRISTSIFVSRNASIESFPFNLTATFFNSSKIEQVVNSTSLIPVGAIDLSTSGLTVTPSSATPGSIISVSFVLTDIGTAGASAVSVGAVLPSGFSAFGSNPVYVGDISADEQAPVTLSLQASNSITPGTYKIPIKINYLNPLRQNVTVMSNVSVTIGSGTSAFGSSGTSGGRFAAGGGGSGIYLAGGIFLPIILVIAIIAVSYLYIRERRKNKRASK